MKIINNENKKLAIILNEDKKELKFVIEKEKALEIVRFDNISNKDIIILGTFIENDQECIFTSFINEMWVTLNPGCLYELKEKDLLRFGEVDTFIINANKNSNFCDVCTLNINTVLQPCGHKLYCNYHAEESKNFPCKICKKEIQGFKEFY